MTQPTPPSTDARLYAPAALRNRDPILAVLQPVLPASGLVLEVASGSGEHALCFARALPNLRFQPTDPDPSAVASCAAWRVCEGADTPNLLPPLRLDAQGTDWPVARADAVLCINMIHIAPWGATEGLFRGASQVLGGGGPLITYGPYRRNGRHTAPSNAEFDETLRARNPAWGVRDLEAIVELAVSTGFTPPDIIPMPANNFTLVFQRR